MRGFTLVELLIVIAVGFILIVAAIPIYGNLQVRTQLKETQAQIIQALRTTRNDSLAGFNNSPHGVYFVINSSGVDSYVVYQGVNYIGRDTSYDQVFNIEQAIALTQSGFLLTGQDVDINFSVASGKPNNVGTMILTHEVQGSETINVNSLGMIN